MLSTDKLTMIYGDRVLFQGASLHFSARRRYGLVGANGAGKTTFLKILKGLEEPTDGIVQIPKEARVGILDQEYFRFGEKRILDLVLMGDKELWDARMQKDTLLAKEIMTDEEIKLLSETEELISRKGGYRAEARAAQLLSGLGIKPKQHGNKLSTLSGGYKLRVLLAQVLFIQPEILLLDEPTNYLDIFSIRQLEKYLIDYPGTLILSSHDRFFLNQVCQEIIDIDYGTIRRYVGNFNHFIEEKKKEVVVKESQLESLAKRKKEIERFVDRFKAKASKARQASSRQRMIEKLVEEEKGYQIFPTSRQYPHFHFQIGRPSGREALTVKDVDKSFEDHPVLKGISFQAMRQERIALVGPNGMGKSTLLEVLTNNLPADKGTHRWGPHTKWSYFPQNFHRLLNEDLTLYDWLSGISKEIPEQKIRQTLGKMLFDEHATHKKIRALSGGEAARLVFAHLMLTEQNFLILDEPTNHLDMESIAALIQGLKEYDGTLILVSHNRYFISEVANRIIELLPDGINDFQGGYEEFVEKHENDYFDQMAIKSVAAKKPCEEKKEERRKKNRLKREIERLEKEIEKLEKEIEKINTKLGAPGFYEKTPPNFLQEILNQKDRCEKSREKALNLWEDKLEELDHSH